MSTPFVTVTPEDPDYEPYLLGSFSKTLRALPVESFRQHSNRERITFRLVPVAEISKPHWLIIYFRACRPELLGLTLGPFFATGLYMMKLQHQAPPNSWMLAALGLFFLHVSAFLFNDFRDHMRGVDFANRRRGSQVIQKGWASAREVRGWGYVNAALALACGLPSLVFSPKLALIVVAAAAFVMALSTVTPKLARYGLPDLMVLAGLGPLLTAASALAFGEQIPRAVLWLGVAFGALAVLTLEVRQLENLFRAGRDSFRTFIGAFDFDRARKVVRIQIILVAVLQVAIAVEVLPRSLAIVGFFFALWPLYFVFDPVRRAASPLSSDLVHLGRRAVWAQTALLLWWGASLWI
jgi:1,4-dihydroxy-2-naphthoate octaprenyltransferase